MKTWLVIGAIVVGGVGAGVAVERAGLASLVSESEIVAALDAVPYYACPDSAPVGDLHRGDRVLVTGRDDDGGWVEIRAPYDVGDRVWVEAKWLDPDSDLQALAGVECELSDVDAAGEPASTTSTTEVPGATGTTGTTAVTGTTGTTAVTGTTGTTAATGTTGTTEAPATSGTPPSDEQGPALEDLVPSVSEIWEDAEYGGCPTQLQSLGVFVSVIDPAGVASVSMSWSVGTQSGSTAMVLYAEPFYAGVIGPLPDDTVSADTPISVTVTAYDGLGNQSSISSGSIAMLHNCVIG